jgi:hypothetical protein
MGTGSDAVAVELAPALVGQDVDRDGEQLLGQFSAQRTPRRAAHAETREIRVTRPW